MKSVNNMDSTVLVPIKLRDMDLKSNKNGTSKAKLPPVLQTGDLYAFYLLLHDAKKELLWGPTSALSTMATFAVPSTLRGSSGTLNLNASNSSNFNFASPITSGWANSSSVSNGSFVSGGGNRIVPSITDSKTSGSSASLASMEGASITNAASLPNGTSGSVCKRENTHSRQPSDDSLASYGSGTSTLDLDSESEADSLLHERDSNRTDHTLHLAASFKHHLQGLHTILHQLSDAADFFCARYQEEIETPTTN